MNARSAALGGALVALTLAAPAPAGALSRGDLVVSDQGAFGGSGGLIKVNPKSGKESTLSTNGMAVNSSHQLFSDPTATALNAGGKLLVAEQTGFGGTGGVIKVNPRTGKESKVSANDQPINASRQFFVGPDGIAVDDAGRILVSDFDAFGGPGGVIKVNPKTGKESKLSANDQPVNASSQLFDEPFGITLNRRGKILVGDVNAFGGTGGVIKVDPDTGKESKVSANDQPVNSSSQLFAAPAGIDRNARGKILVTDFSAFGGPGGVIKVNPETGKESKLSANDQPVNSSHQLFSQPVGITVVRR